MTNRKVPSPPSTRPVSETTDDTSDSPEEEEKPVPASFKLDKQDEQGVGDTATTEVKEIPEKESEDEASEDEVTTDPTRLSKRMSNTPSLDNIDLNDEGTGIETGTGPGAATGTTETKG